MEQQVFIDPGILDDVQQTHSLAVGAHDPMVVRVMCRDALCVIMLLSQTIGNGLAQPDQVGVTPARVRSHPGHRGRPHSLTHSDRDEHARVAQDRGREVTIEFARAVRNTERPAADFGGWGSTSRRYGLWRRRNYPYCREKSRSSFGSAGPRLSMDGAQHSLLHGVAWGQL